MGLGVVFGHVKCFTCSGYERTICKVCIRYFKLNLPVDTGLCRASQNVTFVMRVHFESSIKTT